MAGVAQGTSSRTAITGTAATLVGALAGGAVAASLTDLLLAAAGQGSVDGLTLGMAAAPILVIWVIAGRQVSSATERHAFLLALGAAWFLAALFDQHATGVVAVDGEVAELVHHGAGLVGAWIGSAGLASSATRRPA